MPSTIQRLELDPTGLNPNNRIIDEPHTLSDRPTRSIAPLHGAFFSNGLLVKDNGNILQRGIDYQIVELHQEATALYAKEISSVILIINPNVSGVITITYQALGGVYSRTDKAIANLYETLVKDNRPVNWSNVLNKPDSFTPTLHRHLLDDLYGFEGIVDYLERIKSAITIGQTSVVLEIVNSLLNTVSCGEGGIIRPSQQIMRMDTMLYILSKRKILSSVHIDTNSCTWTKGNSAKVYIDTIGYPQGRTLHWELYSPDGKVPMFGVTSGTVVSNNKVIELSVYVPAEIGTAINALYMGIKENENDKDFIAVTHAISVLEPISVTSSYGFMTGTWQEPTMDEMFASQIEQDEGRRLWTVLTNY